MKKVYMCFASDIIHSAHIDILARAAAYGEITVGLLTDDVIVTYDRPPLVSLEERRRIFENLNHVSRVVVQDTLSYKKNLELLKPDYVVHGDDWRDNVLSDVRREVIELLKGWGGELIEFPYTRNESITVIEQNMRERSRLPDIRRPKLRQMLRYGRKPLRIMEAHSGLSGIIVERAAAVRNGVPCTYDGMWVSSLCDSTMKGKPDIELVDVTSRMRTIDEIMEVTTKPIILDGDTGGLTEHFLYTIKTLERSGVSAVIIEDKTGLKMNSLFGNEVAQTQETVENFSRKISLAKAELETRDFMLIARIESLILEKGMDEALSRAFAYVEAGADGIMIHSRRKEPDEIFEFCRLFREKNADTPLVVVPTTFAAVTEEEFAAAGVDVVIYANHLIRSAYPAMRRTAERILENGRCLEASAENCMPIKEILRLMEI